MPGYAHPKEKQREKDGRNKILVMSEERQFGIIMYQSAKHSWQCASKTANPTLDIKIKTIVTRDTDKKLRMYRPQVKLEYFIQA